MHRSIAAESSTWAAAINSPPGCRQRTLCVLASSAAHRFGIDAPAVHFVAIRQSGPANMRAKSRCAIAGVHSDRLRCRTGSCGGLVAQRSQCEIAILPPARKSSHAIALPWQDRLNVNEGQGTISIQCANNSVPAFMADPRGAGQQRRQKCVSRTPFLLPHAQKDRGCQLLQGDYS